MHKGDFFLSVNFKINILSRKLRFSGLFLEYHLTFLRLPTDLHDYYVISKLGVEIPHGIKDGAYMFLSELLSEGE